MKGTKPDSKNTNSIPGLMTTRTRQLKEMALRGNRNPITVQVKSYPKKSILHNVSESK